MQAVLLEVTCSGLAAASAKSSSVQYLEGQSEKMKTKAKQSGVKDRLPQVSLYTPSTPESLMSRPGRRNAANSV